VLYTAHGVNCAQSSRKMGLKWEAWYPFAGALAVGAAGYFGKFHFHTGPSGPVVEPVLTNAITIAAILVGFLTAALALLPALDSSLMTAIRQTSYFGLLNSYLRSGIWSCCLFVIFTMGGFWLSDHLWYPWVWLAMAGFAMLCFYRITSTIFVIASRPKGPAKPAKKVASPPIEEVHDPTPPKVTI
jgi:hypothetical protein